MSILAAERKAVSETRRRKEGQGSSSACVRDPNTGRLLAAGRSSPCLRASSPFSPVCLGCDCVGCSRSPASCREVERALPRSRNLFRENLPRHSTLHTRLAPRARLLNAAAACTSSEITSQMWLLLAWHPCNTHARDVSFSATARVMSSPGPLPALSVQYLYVCGREASRTAWPVP